MQRFTKQELRWIINLASAHAHEARDAAKEENGAVEFLYTLEAENHEEIARKLELVLSGGNKRIEII